MAHAPHPSLGPEQFGKPFVRRLLVFTGGQEDAVVRPGIKVPVAGRVLGAEDVCVVGGRDCHLPNLFNLPGRGIRMKQVAGATPEDAPGFTPAKR